MACEEIGGISRSLFLVFRSEIEAIVLLLRFFHQLLREDKADLWLPSKLQCMASERFLCSVVLRKRKVCIRVVGSAAYLLFY